MDFILQSKLQFCKNSNLSMLVSSVSLQVCTTYFNLNIHLAKYILTVYIPF